MIEVDLIKKHGKKALGMEEHGHHKQTWRQRLLEIAIIVFAVTLSIQLHNWHEHSLEREKERKQVAPDQHNLVAVMAAGAMQKYLGHASSISDILDQYHGVMQHSRQLIRQIDSQLAE